MTDTNNVHAWDVIGQEDMTHLQVLHALAEELQQALADCNRKCNGIRDKATLLKFRLEQNELLEYILHKQRRHLRYMNGEKIEPEVHYAEAVLTGFGGLEH